MTNVELLFASFEKVARKREDFIHSFYELLFERYPEMKHFFEHVDMAKQEEKLIKALSFAICNMESEKEFEPVVRDLGSLHKSKNITPDHYQQFNECLIETIKKYSSSSWNEKTETAWKQALKSISHFMQNGHFPSS